MHSLRVERCAFSALVLLIEKIVREGGEKLSRPDIRTFVQF